MAGPSQGILLLLEAIDLISNTTILGVFYGIAFTLYCFCAQLLYSQIQELDKRNQARFTLTYISLTLTCAMAYLGVGARITQLAYVNNADFPGGPLGFESSYNPTTNAYEVAGSTLDLIVVVLTTAIQIWRLWTIWSGTQYGGLVIILPLLLLSSYLVLHVLTAIVPAFLPIDRLGITAQSAEMMTTSSYAVLSAFTAVVTGLIVTRLLLVRKRHVKLLGTSDTFNPYMSIVAMLVESYALETIWSVATAISCGVKSPGFFLLLENDSIIKVIAYFLVIYRVSTGRGWTKDTGRKLTTLRWDRGAPTISDEISNVRPQAPATRVMVAAYPPPLSQHRSIV